MIIKDSLAVRSARWLLLSTALVPVVIVPSVFFPYVTLRTVFFRSVVEVVMGIFIYLLATREHQSRGRRDPFLWALVAFTGASIISALFSPARNRSLFGDFERMGGAWALLHFLIYYAMLRVFFGEKQWKQFLKLALSVSVFVSLLDFLQYRALLARAQTAGANSAAVSSTIGNSGLLGIYLFFGVAFAVYLTFTEDRRRNKIIFAVMGLIDFYGIILSQNRSSFVGIVVALSAGGIAYLVVFRGRHLLVVGTALAVSAIFGLGVVTAIRSPDSSVTRHLPGIFNRLAQSSPTGGDAIRLRLWRAAIDGFRDRPIVGYGPENFHLVWSAQFQPELYGQNPEERVDRAHNALLEVLSTTGLLGLLSFLAMWLALFYALWRASSSGRITPGSFAIFSGVFAGYSVCLFPWFFDINSVLPWLAACALFFFVSSDEQIVQFAGEKKLTGRTRVWLGLGGLLLASSLWLHSFETMRIARIVYRTQALDHDISSTIHDYFKVFDSSVPQTTHTPFLFGRFMGRAVTQVARGSDPKTRSLMDTAFARGIVEMERERQRDPRNELIYIQQARFALLAASYYGLPGYYAFAVKTMREAVALSPRRIQPRIVLAYTLMMGRSYDEARAQLLKARSIYSRSGKVYFYMAYLDQRQRDFVAAAAAMDSSFKYNYTGSPDLYFEIADSLAHSGSFATSARLMDSYLLVRRPALRPGAPKPHPISPEEIKMLGRLPVLWARAGETQKVRSSLKNFVLAYPAGAPAVAAFLADFQKGTMSGWFTRGTLLASPAEKPTDALKPRRV